MNELKNPEIRIGGYYSVIHGTLGNRIMAKVTAKCEIWENFWDCLCYEDGIVYEALIVDNHDIITEITDQETIDMLESKFEAYNEGTEEESLPVRVRMR